MLAVATLIAAACATTPAPPPGPPVSPTGVVFEPGVPPGQTRFSQVAVVYISQGYNDRALDQALQGIASNPHNPIHFYLAGLAYTRLRQYAAADSMFDRAEEIYPAYALEIEPERERAWAVAFNEGLEAHVAGNVEATIEAWRRATQIYDMRPEAHRNLGTLLAEVGEYDEAIRVFRAGLAGLERAPVSRLLSPEEESTREQARVTMSESVTDLLLLAERYAEAEPLLRSRIERDPENVELRTQLASALTGQGRHDEAVAIYGELLAEESLDSSDLFKVGVALFRIRDYDRASQAFRRLTELEPASRDAWFNYANSLFASQNWETLLPAANRLVELDPLSENALLIAARAHLESGDQQGALRLLEAADSKPVHLADLQFRPSPIETRVDGRIVGNAAAEGDTIRLLFTFLNEGEVVGTQEITLQAPRTDASSPIEVVFPNRASAYRYEVLPPAAGVESP
ncbi:MAG TPA: tetratricopeptide repeat protein [Longimicrobiales bacterium]|nr:tetratricopeptide repeat protein [Longimicrobiales bacterium]